MLFNVASQTVSASEQVVAQSTYELNISFSVLVIVRNKYEYT